MKDTTTKGQNTPQPGGTGSSVSEGLAPSESLRRSEATGGAFRETRLGWSVLAVVWVISATYLGLQLHHGWVPVDAGEFAEMAGRVLQGQVPYRDFEGIYTAGLTYLNALAFRLFGANFFSLRIPLFIFFLGWVPSVYLIARRFTRPITAGAVTLLAVAWSVPNYPEAMTSWYNLFFATWGTLALLRYTEIQKKRWLWIAGFCAGLSFLVKIVGLYFIAAALLFFVFREQSLSKAGVDQKPRRSATYRLFCSAGLISYLAAVFILISQRPWPANFLNFVLPSVFLVTLLLMKIAKKSGAGNKQRFLRLLSMAAPFLVGVFTPVGTFLLWYAHEAAIGNWWEGVFIRSRDHIVWVAGKPQPLVVVVGLVPAAVILLISANSKSAQARRLARFAAPGALLGLLLLAWKVPSVYAFLGDSAPFLVPAIALGAALWLWREVRIGNDAVVAPQRIFLLATVASCCALVQFPSPGPVYFDYVAPLAILGLCSLLATLPRYERGSVSSVLIFYLAFAVCLHAPGYFDAMRSVPDRPVKLRRLSLPRSGNLLVKASEASEYEKLVPLVQAHASGAYIFCTPNCPAVYFLSARRNPTRTICEFTERDFPNVAINTDNILFELENRRVTAVVLNFQHMIESVPIPAGLHASLDSRFPNSERVGNFEVRWRSPHDLRSFEPGRPDIRQGSRHDRTRQSVGKRR